MAARNKIALVGSGNISGTLAHLIGLKELGDVPTSFSTDRLFLAGVPLSPSIRATSDFGDLGEADALLVVAPAQHVGGVLAQINVGTKGVAMGWPMLRSWRRNRRKRTSFERK